MRGRILKAAKDVVLAVTQEGSEARGMARSVGVAILLIAAAAIMVGFVLANALIRKGVEAFGPKVTRTSVTIEKIRISPFSGRGLASGLVVGNPEGFKTSSAVEVGEFHIALSPKSLLTDTVDIQEVVVDRPQITYEVGLKGSNLGRIAENVESSSAEAKKAGPAGQPPPSTETVKGKKIRVRHLAVRGGRIRLSAPLLRGQTVDIPLADIHLRNLGGESGGVSAAEVFTEVLRVVLKAAGDTVASSGQLKAQAVESLRSLAAGGAAGAKTAEGHAKSAEGGLQKGAGKIKKLGGGKGLLGGRRDAGSGANP